MRDAVEGVDAVVLVVDAAAGVGRGDAYVYEHQVAAGRGLKVCVVNKVDGLAHHKLVPQLAAVAGDRGVRRDRAGLGARRRGRRACCATCIVARMPEGPALYPSDEDTDEPLEITLAELVREQALRVTREEVPHSIAVVVEEMEREGDLTQIHASLVVERDSQKGIVIGKGGETLKAIGTAARMEMEPMLGTRVFLDLRVKVLKEWQRDPQRAGPAGLLSAPRYVTITVPVIVRSGSCSGTAYVPGARPADSPVERLPAVDRHVDLRAVDRERVRHGVLVLDRDEGCRLRGRSSPDGTRSPGSSP